MGQLEEKIRSFFDNPEEFYIGAFLQFPLFYVLRWKIFFIMALCAILWRLGGWQHGSKLWRWVGVPLVVCGSSLFAGCPWTIFLAAPFMVKLAPSYGKDGILWEWFGKDLPVRLICFLWYWSAFTIAYELT
jgi:hypothetical protein